MNDSLQNQKNILRAEYKKLRDSIAQSRRRAAERKLLKHLSKFLEPYKYVLSFSSIKNEISTEKLNQVLQERDQLVLPKVEGDHLKLYHVKDLKQDCVVSKWGILEPDSEKCIQSSPLEVSIALVPGLAFDHKHYRLGYGKGHYDRLLKDLKSHTVGICFNEQIFQQQLPISEYDISCLSVFSF